MPERVFLEAGVAAPLVGIAVVASVPDGADDDDVTSESPPGTVKKLLLVVIVMLLGCWIEADEEGEVIVVVGAVAVSAPLLAIEVGEIGEVGTTANTRPELVVTLIEGTVLPPPPPPFVSLNGTVTTASVLPA